MRQVIRVLLLRRNTGTISADKRILSKGIVTLRSQGHTTRGASAKFNTITNGISNSGATLTNRANGSKLHLTLVDHLTGSNTKILQHVNILSSRQGAHLARERRNLLIRSTYTRMQGLTRLLMNGTNSKLDLKRSTQVNEMRAQSINPILMRVNTRTLNRGQTQSVTTTAVRRLSLTLAHHTMRAKRGGTTLLAMLLRRLENTVRTRHAIIVRHRGHHNIRRQWTRMLNRRTNNGMLTATRGLLNKMTTQTNTLNGNHRLLASKVNRLRLIDSVGVTLTGILRRLLAQRIMLSIHISRMRRINRLNITLGTTATNEGRRGATNQINVSSNLSLLRIFNINSQQTTGLNGLGRKLRIAFLGDLYRPVVRTLVP